MPSVTRTLMGDPEPGRTPWAPAEPSPQVRAARAKIAAEVEPTPAEATTPKPMQINGSSVKSEPFTTTPVTMPTVVSEIAAAVAAEATRGAQVRPIATLALDDLQVRPAPTEPPIVEWMAPTDLLVDAAYQRDLTDASVKLIRRIVEAWDWRRFKPPIVAWTERGFEIIDGQHTATAAATRGFASIPVLVVEAAELQDRAGAFIGHNRDRKAVAPVELHHAAVAAGDETALTVQQVCARAGITILRSAYGSRVYKVGETLAVGSIAALVGRRHAKGAREVLEVLVKAERAPVTANEVKAVELLLFDEDYAGRFEPDELAKAIRTLGDKAEQDARLVVAANSVPLWKGLAATWFKKTRKKT